MSYILFGLSNGHLWMLFAARLLAGLLSSASIGVAFAYVADITSPENRARGLGILGACFGLGFMMGPAIGGWLGGVHPSLPAFVAAAMALLNFLASSAFLPESLSKDERERLKSEERAPFGQLLTRAIKGPAAGLFLLTFLMTFGFAAIEQVFGFFLLAQGLADNANQPQRMGTIMAMVGLIGIIVQGGLIGRLVKRFGEGRIAQLGLGLLTLGFLLLTIPREWGAMLFLACLPLSGGRSMIGPALSALISRKANLGQGLVLSISQSFDALARTVGPLTAGFLFHRFSPTTPYYFSAGLTFAALVLTVLAPQILALHKEEIR